MSVALLIFTDGRIECLERTVASFTERLRGDFASVTIVNDKPGVDWANYLKRKYGGDTRHISNTTRLGFSGTIQAGWRALPSGTDYVFHLEDDFELNADLELSSLITILDERPDVVQVALKRQAWNPEEEAAGGIVELHPDDFCEEETTVGPITTHRRFFTTNPCLYRMKLTTEGWPQVEHSEGTFTQQVLRQSAKSKFAFWGRKFDPPMVTHIGTDRVGTGY